MTRSAKTSQMSLLTICLPVPQRSAPHLDNCLRSLFDEIGDANLKLLGIYAASDLESAKIFEEWKQKDARLTVHVCEGGLSAMKNMAWEIAKTDWVALLDAQSTVVPGWLSAVTNELGSRFGDPKCAGFSGGTILPQNTSRLFSAYSILPSSSVGGQCSLVHYASVARQAVEHIPSWNAVYRVAALRKVSGFDRDYETRASDLDLSYRLIGQGYQLWTCPGMAVERATCPSSAEWLKEKFAYGRGRCFFVKNHPQAFHPRYAVAPVMTAIYSLLLLGIPFFLKLIPILLTLAFAHAVILGIGNIRRALRTHTGAGVFLYATALLFLAQLFFGWGFLFELRRPPLRR
jgi:cellulose synthase/poly-beta-1,6-N-acetylglucosamine synthase-like glycosyltransferase